MAFRLLDQLPQYRDTDGSVLAGGTLNFYITATNTAKNVYSDKTLGTSLGSTITLDADGRHSEDVWLAEDTSYRVVLKDSDGNTIWLREDVRSLDTSVSANLPDAADATEGQVLASDGTSGGWYFVTVLQVPDPSGHSGATLKSDGTDPYWEDAAAEDAPTSSAAASGYSWVDGVLHQWGSDTCTSTGSLSVTKAVTFGQTFDAAPYHVSITPVLSSGVTSNSPSGFPCARYSSPSTTGFTAGFFVGEENTGGTDTINANIPFTWYAVGAKATAP